MWSGVYCCICNNGIVLPAKYLPIWIVSVSLLFLLRFFSHFFFSFEDKKRMISCEVLSLSASKFRSSFFVIIVIFSISSWVFHTNAHCHSHSWTVLFVAFASHCIASNENWKLERNEKKEEKKGEKKIIFMLHIIESFRFVLLVLCVSFPVFNCF